MGERLISQNKKTMLTLFTSMLAMVMTIVTNFFLSPYIVQTLGEEANGFTQLANNFVNYASLITVALNSMAGRFVTMHYYRGEKKDSCQIYSSIFIANVAIILTMIVPAIILLSKLESVINITKADVQHVKILFAFVFANFFVTQINSVFGITTYVANKQYVINTINAIKTILNAACLLFLFSVFMPRIYYVSLVAVFLSLLTVPFYFAISRKVLPELRINIHYFRFKAVVQVFSAGIWNVINQCGVLLMTGVDLLLANVLLGPLAMGILSVSKVLPNCIAQIASNVNASFSPNITIAYAEQEAKGVLRSLRYAMKCSSILISIPIMVLCVFGDSFYALWQPTMEAKTLSVLSFWACFQYIPFAGTQALFSVYTATNKLKLNSITVLIGGCINVLTVIILIQFCDAGVLVIAAVSSIISVIRNLAITVPYTAKILRIKWYTFYKDVLLSCICCAVNALICMLFQAVIEPITWCKMILSVFCASASCLLGLFAIMLTKEEKKQLIKKLRAFVHV